MKDLTIQDIETIVKRDECRVMEAKETTGELIKGMQSGCAFLNTEGGWLFFGMFKGGKAEGWGRGILNIFTYCKEAGMPEPEYDFVQNFVCLTIRFKTPLTPYVSGEVNGATVTKQSLSSHQVVAKLSLSIPTITDLLQKMVNPMSAKDMRQFCGQKDATHFKSNVIDPLIASGLVAMTQPDSPKSPTQRYVLTDAAQKLLS